MSGTLYLLPVGLGEATAWQAVLPEATQQTACRLTHFVVENAKSARAALKWLGHPGPLRELDIEELPPSPTAAEIDRLLAPLAAGHDLGLMSEAGCPAIADPGALIVRRAHELNIVVRPLTGPSALLLALMASGLDGQRFAFHGYLPQREPERTQRIVELERQSRQRRQTQLFIETPYRNGVLLSALLAACRPDTWLTLACDLTQPSERILTQRIEAWRRRPASADFQVKRPTVFLLLSED